MAKLLRHKGKLVIDLSQRPALEEYRERAPIWQASARSWHRGDIPLGEGKTEHQALAELAACLGYTDVEALLNDAHLNKIDQ